MESVGPVTRYLLYYCAILLRNVTIFVLLLFSATKRRNIIVMVAANANSYMI